LAILVVVGFGNLGPQNFTPALPHGVSGLMGASAFVFVSYNGVTKIAAVAEEVKNPGRTVPMAIFFSLGIVALIYCSVALTLVVNLPTDELAGDLRPIHTLAVRLLGPWGGYVAAVVGVLTMTSMANAGLLAASRFPFAMSRDRLLPHQLEHLSSRFGTPVYAILLTGIAMSVAISFLGVEKLAKLASAVVIALYIAENVAVVFFRESGVRWYAPKYRTPFYPWLQGFGILSGLFLLSMLGPAVVLGGVLILLPGVALFLFYGRSRVSRRGIVGVRGRRAELLQAPPSNAQEVQDTITGRARVVVALFGNERGPETLVEVGTGLAQKDRLEVIHVTEVPEQLQLGDALREESKVRSLRRRFYVMAAEEHFRLDFHAIASRDIVRTVNSVTRSVGCDWLVMAWRGRGRTALLPYNPLGWLINHLDANLALFRDAGVRYIREIVVYAEPGPHDALVVGTADDLAQLWKAHLTLIRFVGEVATEREREDEAAYLEQLRRLCSSPSKVKLLGGKRLINSVANISAGYDLLVAGMPDVTLWAQLRGTQHEEIMRRAECSVLFLKTPRVRTHEAYERKTRHVSSSTPLLDHLERGALEPRIAVAKKDALFQHCARVFADLLEGVHAKQIADALWERERTQNTSVGHGVALPHATLANARSAVVGVFTTKEPIDYQGPDGVKVDVFFVTISPPSERQLHLQLLSGIAGLSLGTNLLERLRAAEDTETMLVAIRECAFDYATTSHSN
jgi:mannitol/fructose-specific phosphotransferase system IIA component (Ntr-type)